MSTLFIKVDQDMPGHPKIADLTDRAFRDLMRLWCYCAKYQTNGTVAARRYDAMTTPDTGPELITAGMVEVRGDGYYMHDYLDHQQSKEEREAVRALRSDLGRKGGLQSAAARRSSNGSSNSLTNSSSKSLSGPSSRSSSKSSSKTQAEVEVEVEEEVDREVLRTSLSARKRAATPIPDDWQPTTGHAAYATEHHLDLNSEAFKFRNHAIANDRRQARWDATFTTWLAKARDYAAPKPATTRKPGLPEGW